MSFKKPLLGRFVKVGIATILGLSLQLGGSNALSAQELLTVGSEAPELDIEHWVSDRDGDFSEVTEFEEGKVYVVEFWATWCGPCLRSMPHLASLQDEYADKGVQIISVSREDLETVEDFMEGEVKGSKDATQTYSDLTKGYCVTVDPDGSVSQDYMKAAKQRGIPAAFIVGKTGIIEWIGHPVKMDEPLEKVVDDSWDRETFAKDLKTAAEEQAAFGAMQKKAGNLVEDLKFEDAIKEVDAFEEGLSEDSKYKAACDALRTGLAMKAGGDLAIETMNKIGESSHPRSALSLIAGVYVQLRKGEDLHEDLVDATVNAAQRMSEFQKEEGDDTAAGQYLHYKASLLFENDELVRAIETQEKAVVLFDSRATQSQLKKFKAIKAEQDAPPEEEAPEAEAAKEDASDKDASAKEASEKEAPAKEAAASKDE